MVAIDSSKGERSKTLLRNIAANFSGRVINLASMIVSIPLAVHALGPESYGYLAVVLSFTTFFAYADLGLGLAIVNEVASAEQRNDHKASQRAITQAWMFLWVAAIAVIVIGAIAVMSGIVPRILPGISSDEMIPAWAMLVGCTALGIPFALSQRVMFALQMGLIAQAWATAGRVAITLGALAASIFTSKLVVYIGIFAGIPVVFAALSTLHLFFVLKPTFCPRLQALGKEGLRSRLSTGLKFTLLQGSNFVETGIDPLLMTHFFSATIIAQFDLISRLFGYVPALASIALAPLWPALSNALHSNDRLWFKTVYRRAQVGVIGLTICASIVITLACEPIIAIWTGMTLHVEGLFLLKIAMALWVVTNVASALQGMALNALGKIGSQAIISVGLVLLILPIKLYCYSMGSLSFAIFAMVVIYFIKQCMQSAIFQRSLEDKMGIGSK